MILEFSSIISILISLLIINGLFNLAEIIKPIKKKKFFIEDEKLLLILNFFLITNSLSILTYFYSLYFKINPIVISVVSIFIISSGFYKPIYFKNFVNNFNQNDKKVYLIYFLLFFYFLLSLSPNTDPDSLEYHLTIPIYQLNFQNIPIVKYWLTSQLSGAGESFFMYGITLGSIYLSQFLQFISLFLLIIFILNFQHKNYNFSDQKKIYVSLIILTMPVLLFLVSTSKPQMFPLINNFFCLILTTIYLPKLNIKYSIKCFILIIFLLLCSIHFKFNFILSSGLISLLAIYEMYKKGLLVKSIFIALPISLVLIAPKEIYEFLNLNKNIFFNFFNPVTDIYSSVDINNSLKHGTGNSRLFPIWIFFPYPNFSVITYTLGPMVLYFIFGLKLNLKIIKKYLLLSLTFIFISLVFAQPVGRFFIEPFIWLLFVSIFYFSKNKSRFINYLQNIIVFTSSLFLIFLAFFSLNLFKGNLNKDLLDKVLTNNADGYLLYKWANEVLPDNSVILTTHRSIAFYKYKAIPYEFRLFSNSHKKNGFTYYLDNILKEKPAFILYSSSELNNSNDILKNCRGELFKFKKNAGQTSGRSPFFKSENYDGYIFHLDLYQLKNCKI